jgi:hypothetical protein
MPSPSSERRRANLQALVREFTLRDIGPACASALLGCSLSASRYYLAELLDAGLVAPQLAREKADCGKHQRFTLKADAPAVRDFLHSLDVSTRSAGPLYGSTGGQIRRVWLGANHWRDATHAPARRDPLVAALFGAAELS